MTPEMTPKMTPEMTPKMTPEMTPEMTQAAPGYRPCVGVMLVNRERNVFVGERLDAREHGLKPGVFWQMPQGGVDPGEDIEQAALRELAEETGVRRDRVELVARTREPLRYDLPEELIGKLWGGAYRGQEQVWFLAKFLGQDADIDLAAHDPPEFGAWQWVRPEQLPDLIVPFKREVYARVVEEFFPAIRRLEW